MQFVAVLFTGLALCSLSVTSTLAEGRYFNCPVPEGFEAAQSDLEKILYSAMDKEMGADKGGWYQGKMTTGSVAFVAPHRKLLPVTDYPYFVGSLWGGPLYGGKLLSPMVCGFSLSSYGWLVTIEWEGHGFASFDIRDALAELPPPTKSNVGGFDEKPILLPLHEFRFSIGGQDFVYLLSGVTIAMNRVYRPDLLQDKQYKSTINEDLFPTLDSVSGTLLAAASYTSRPEWSEPGAEKPVPISKRHWFDDEPYTQPFDATSTPYLLGRVMAVASGGTKEPGQPADLDLHDNILTLTLPDGRTGQTDISAWAGTLLNSGKPGIPSPLIPIDIDGQAFLLVVSFASPFGDSNKMERLIGDLFAGEPPLVTDARQRPTEPKRP